MTKNFAKIENGIVVDIIITPSDILENFFEETLSRPGNWVEYSDSAEFRKVTPIIGSTYDEVLDIFILPQPYPSWSLDENNDWQAPTPLPEDSWNAETDKGTVYVWSEESLSWISVSQV